MLWTLDVIIFIIIHIFLFMLVSRFKKIIAKRIKSMIILKNQTDSGNIVHPRELHCGFTRKFVNNRNTSLMPSSNNYLLSSCALFKHRIKCIHYIEVRSAPRFKYFCIVLVKRFLVDTQFISYTIEFPLDSQGIFVVSIGIKTIRI